MAFWDIATSRVGYTLRMYTTESLIWIIFTHKVRSVELGYGVRTYWPLGSLAEESFLFQHATPHHGRPDLNYCRRSVSTMRPSKPLVFIFIAVTATGFPGLLRQFCLFER
jgi:hypothetical protein